MAARDLRYALRLFGKAPGFTAAAVLTLAIGIAADTAVLGVANAVLLQPLPYRDPNRLVLLCAMEKGTRSLRGPLSYPRLQQITARNRSFQAMAGFSAESFNLTGRGNPEQISGMRVSKPFFDILGVHPTLGRTFTPREGEPGGDPVALISDAFWHRRFAADPTVVSQPVTLDGVPFTVIGVLPAGFRFDALAERADIYIPRVFELSALQPAQIQAGAGYLEFLARLQPNVTLAQAQSEIDALGVQYRAERAGAADANPDRTVRVGNLRDETVSGIKSVILIFSGAVSLVLLMACTNVAGLLLSRSLGRQKEIAIRTALGATRAGLIRQFLAESLLLSLAGGACGALLAAWGTRLIGSLGAAWLPRAQEIQTDWHTLLFILLVSLAAGAVVGLAPALQVSRPDLNTMLRSEGRGSTSGQRRNTLRSLLVIVQVAVSLLLLTGAGLLLRNFMQMRHLRLGIDPRHLLTMNIALPTARYTRTAETAFFKELAARVRALPGVRDAAFTSALPLSTVRRSPALPEGFPAVPLAQRPVFNIQTTTPGYIATVGAVLLSGRDFTGRDVPDAPPVAIVNQTLARACWPNQNPIGKHILLGRMANAVEVVGVLADIRNLGLAADPYAEIFLPFAQLPWPYMHLVVRTAADPHGLVRAVREQVGAMDRDQPVTAIETMDDVVDGAATQPRFATALLTALSAATLLLAMVAIYGTIALSIAERTQEIGIRTALGASRPEILLLVLRQGMLLTLAGIAVGLAAAMALTRFLSTLLYQVSATDPLVFAAVAALFAVIALAASYLPARRATRLDPIEALRW